MSKQLRLDPAQLTDVGRKRPHNEDNMAHVIPKDPEVMGKQGALFIVADGMGGHAAGEIASEIAVDTVSKVYYQEDSDEAPALLLRSIKRANALIHQRAAENMLRSGMGTTCVAAILRGSSAYFANVGDSRAYFIRNGQIKRISQDHSWVEEQVRAGLLTEEQARSHAQRNVITRCLGTQIDVDVDIFYEQLQEGDSIVLCSDGLSGLVSDEEMRDIVSQYPPQESVYHLVERANENGGPDNITVIVVKVLEVGVDPPGTRIPVHVGAGTEIADEDTLSMGMLPGRPLAMPGMAETRIPTSPLGYRTSGPLQLGPNASDAVAPVSEKKPISRRKPRRLLYPTLALFVLVLVSLVAGGLYYLFIHTKTVDVDASLRVANGLIQQASGETQTNPANALQVLVNARVDLLQVQDATRSSEQDAQFKKLQATFVNTVQAAITSYNSQALVTRLPCTDTTQKSISNGNTGEQPKVIATIKDQKNTVFSYVLGTRGTLYQLSDTGNTVALLNPFNPLSKQIQEIASDGSRLLVVTATNTTPPTYSLHVLIPDTATAGALKDNNASTIDPKYTKDGSVPSFIAAWGTDVYVVITSATSQNTATILNYKVDGNNKLNAPSQTIIAISTPITSIAAFPNQQLFLLDDGNGFVYSLNLTPGTKPIPAPIASDKPIALPLTVQSAYSSMTMPVPQASASGPAFLTPSTANLLIAGAGTDGKPHLYVADVPNHRLLDLMVTSAGTSTPPPATSPTTNTGNAGGGVANVQATTSTTMALQQQYTSAQVLNKVKSAVTDPKSPQLYLATQSDATTFNLVSVNISKNSTACTSS